MATENNDDDKTYRINENHNLNETSDPIRVNVTVKRGTGTRDQDSYKLKARGETPQDAAADTAALVSELEARDVFARIRNLQPEEDNDE
jgi:TPP-dependent pyruvate/acetoin dehydrogenase alpha subunit